LILRGLREDGVDVVVVEGHKVIVAVAQRNEKTTSLIGIDLAIDRGACGVDAMRPDT
jgi:hypothetical protein